MRICHASRTLTRIRAWRLLTGAPVRVSSRRMCRMRAPGPLRPVRSTVSMKETSLAASFAFLEPTIFETEWPVRFTSPERAGSRCLYRPTLIAKPSKSTTRSISPAAKRRRIGAARRSFPSPSVMRAMASNHAFWSGLSRLCGVQSRTTCARSKYVAQFLRPRARSKVLALAGPDQGACRCDEWIAFL